VLKEPRLWKPTSRLTSDRETGAPQELLRAFDPTAPQVLMRRLAESRLEAAGKMRPGRMRLAGESWDVELSRILPVHQILRAAEMEIDRNRVAHPPKRLNELVPLYASGQARVAASWRIFCGVFGLRRAPPWPPPSLVELCLRLLIARRLRHIALALTWLFAQWMERLWSRAVTTRRSRWQIPRPRKRPK
jgi:hypothetical protein